MRKTINFWVKPTYRFVPQLLNSAMQEGCLSQSCCYIARNVKIKVWMQREILIDAIVVDGHGSCYI